MLEVRLLTKYYNNTPAIRGVSFTIMPGEILGYLGSNGAGKSTTVKILTGLIEPSEGRILYQGKSVHDDFTGFQRRLGYVPEEAHLYPHLSGREYLQLVGRLRGLRREVLEPRIDEFLRLFSLWDNRDDLLSSYSKGMRQKVLLSAALLHNPDVLILDEPFLPLELGLLGWRALPEAALFVALGLLSYQCVFYSWKKLPFACSHLPGKTSIWILVLQVFGLISLIPLVNKLLMAILYNAAAYTVTLCLLIAATAHIYRLRRRGRELVRLKYEEEPEPAIHRLNLLK